MWATLIFAGTGGLLVGKTLALLWALRRVHSLPSLEAVKAQRPSAQSGQEPIRCSVIVAARDEESRIEATMRHLLAQREVEAEFIIVDDRSTDGTNEVLRRFADEDRRVQVKRVDNLPADWLGKCHACHLGASSATGDWILFTDADCWLKADVIARAVRVAQCEQADHVTLTPGRAVEAWSLRAWHLAFLTSLLDLISGVNRDRPRSYFGLGAFNLVRAEAYRQCGGYSALRLTVLDDVKLGLLLHRTGKRTRAFLGASDVECHWGSTLGGMVRLMEKNYFAALDFRLGLVMLAALTVFLLFSIVIAGLLSRTAAGIFAGLAPLSLILPAGILARRSGWSWPCAVFVPFMLPLLLYSLLNSAWVTLRQRGVRWRDTLYSLDSLRAGTVR